MFNSSHIKGAIHLNFSDFTQENLDHLIPSVGTGEAAFGQKWQAHYGAHKLIIS